MKTTGRIRRGRACGKVILAGEHAAVYGYRAVAVGLDCGAHATATRIDLGPSELHVGGLALSVGHDHDLARAFGVVVADVNPTWPVRVVVTTTLPAGSGLGSSAAIGVAVIRALDPFASQSEVLRRAMLWERVFHGNPSGLDAFIAARGGCHAFERGKEAVPVFIPRRAFLCIGQSGAGASTREMVSSVANLKTRDPEVAQATLSAIGAIAEELARSLRVADFRDAGRLMRANHQLLQQLGVSTPAMDGMCELARSAGALGAKMTGGGGGGCVVALCDTRLGADAVLLAWQRESYDGFIAPVGPGEIERTPRCSPSEVARPTT